MHVYHLISCTIVHIIVKGYFLSFRVFDESGRLYVVMKIIEGFFRIYLKISN